MADQLRWWKLWTSVLSDPGVRDLPLEDFARWCFLGVWLRQHGDAGSGVLSRPGRGLAEPWRCRSWGAVRGVLTRLPNVIVEVVETDPDGEPAKIRISMRNWRKYQEDSSWERMRRYRGRKKEGDGIDRHDGDVVQRNEVTVQTRRDETRNPLPPFGGSSQNGLPKYPPELFRHETPCAVVAETGRPWPPGTCVNRAWLDQHPDVKASGRFPAMRDPNRPGEYAPKTCEAHR